MMNIFKGLLFVTSLIFSLTLMASDEKGFGIEDDVENLMYEIEEDKRQSEPQDEYSIHGERGAYSEDSDGDERSPDSLGQPYQNVRKEFLDAGEAAIKKNSQGI